MFIIIARVEDDKNFEDEDYVYDGVERVPNVIKDEQLSAFTVVKPFKCQSKRCHEACSYKSDTRYYGPSRL